MIETLIAAAPQSTEASFYRTSAGAKIDLVLTLPGGQLWAIEIKRSSAPTLEKGFHFACADLKPKQRFVVYPGHERFSLDSVTEVLGLQNRPKSCRRSGERFAEIQMTFAKKSSSINESFAPVEKTKLVSG